MDGTNNVLENNSSRISVESDGTVDIVGTSLCFNGVPIATQGGEDSPAPVVLQHTVTLSAELLRSVNTTPVEIIPAPGIGKMLVVQQALFVMRVTVPFTTEDVSGEFPQGLTAHGFDLQMSWGENLANATADSTMSFDEVIEQFFLQLPSNLVGSYVSRAENQPLTLSSDAVFPLVGGAGTLKVTVFYSTVDL